MGAYSNPQEVVDTQTGQYFQNLQNTISQTVANVGQSYAAKQAQLKKELEANKRELLANQLNVDEANLKLYSEIDKASAGKKGVDFHYTFDPFVKEYGELNMSLQTGASIDRSKTLQRMAQIRSSITSAQEDIATIGSYGESFEKNSANIGNMGGLSASNDPKMVMAYQVLAGKAKGDTSLKVDPNNPSIRTWTVKGNINGKEFEQVIDGNQLKDANQQGGGPFVYIPNTMDAMDQNKLNSGAYIVDTKQDAKGNTTRSLGLINDAYLGKEVLVDSPERITGRTIKQVYREVDKAKIKPLLAIDANKQSAGLLADVRSASAWYNEVYAKGKNDFLTPLDLATQEGKQKFQDAYLQYIVDTIPDKQAVLTPDNNIATVTTVAQKPTKTKPGEAGTPKVTAADKKQAKLDRDVMSLIKTKKGAVRGNDGNVLKIINGRWRAVDKNDVQIAGTEGISNPRELALYIGASRSLIE
jgi:hypothetical protein